MLVLSILQNVGNGRLTLEHVDVFKLKALQAGLDRVEDMLRGKLSISRRSELEVHTLRFSPSWLIIPSS